MEGPATAQALATARSHLAAVTQELNCIQQHFGGPGAGAALGARSGSQGQGGAGGAGAAGGVDLQAVERMVRHLEVDRDNARARAERLQGEKEELVAAQARLEADLRAARRNLEEIGCRLRHREIDLQRLSNATEGLPREELSPFAEHAGLVSAEGPKVVSDYSGKDALASPMLHAITLSGVGLHRPGAPMTKQQALASLRAAHAQLYQEQKHREGLERRMMKDRERLERFMAVAERQRNEISALRQQQQQTPHDDVGVPNEAYLQEAPPPFGGIGGHAGAPPLFNRQQSAPTRLPCLGAKQCG